MLDDEDVLRWTLASRAFRKYGQLSGRHVVPHCDLEITDNFDLSSPKGKLRSIAGFTNLFAIYGSAHFLGWVTLFSSTIEQFLWRWSAIYIATFGLLWFAVLLVGKRIADRAGISKWADFVGGVCVVGFVLAHIVYVLASGYILAESFIQLRYLDPKAYLLPSGPIYFPHFSRSCLREFPALQKRTKYHPSEWRVLGRYSPIICALSDTPLSWRIVSRCSTSCVPSIVRHAKSARRGEMPWPCPEVQTADCCLKIQILDARCASQ